MHDDGLDAEKLAVLRRWGTGLQVDPRGEVAAAGRAITLLIDEIERLHVLVWDRRLYPGTPAPAEPTASAPDAQVEQESPRGAPRPSFRDRLRRAPRQDLPQADPQADSRSEGQFPDVLQHPDDAPS